MTRLVLAPAPLGDAYEIADQSRAMMFAGVAFLTFTLFSGIADVTSPESVISALSRFAAAASACVTVLALMWAYPRSMDRLKWVMCLVGILGVVVHIAGVNFLLRVTADVPDFQIALLVAHLLYALVLLFFGASIIRHPLLPNWLAPAMVCDGLIWLSYYWFFAHSGPAPLLAMCAWGPGIAIEIICAVIFIRVGLKLSKWSRQAIENGH